MTCMLSAAGAVVTAVSASGDTPLHMAAAGGHVAGCEALVALGAELEAAAGDGGRPLHRRVGEMPRVSPAARVPEDGRGGNAEHAET